ncbi:MAG: alpha/beta hydrolase [Acidimicrobiia bacterium]
MSSLHGFGWQRPSGRAVDIRDSLIPETSPSSAWDDPGEIEQLRSAWSQQAELKYQSDIVCDEEVIAGVRCLVANGPAGSPTTLYVHGGGFVAGSPKTARLVTDRLARSVSIVSVDYRLAPEHQFPDGRDDVLKVYTELLSGIGPNLTVAGDSAGANLALAAILTAIEEGTPGPAAVGLISPIVDLTLSGDTADLLLGIDPTFTNQTVLRSFISAYAGNHPLSGPALSPLFSSHLGFLPRTLIQVGSRELLLSDSTRLARRARLLGADVTLDVWEGMWHTWHYQTDLVESQNALSELARFLVGHSTPPESSDLLG